MSGNYLALYNKGKIELRDAESHAEVKSIQLATTAARGKVCSMCFSSCGTKLAICTTSNKVLVYDVETGTEICEFESHDGNRVKTVAFNAAGTRLLTRCYEGRIDMWDICSQERIWSVVLNSVNLSYPRVCFTVDDQRVVASLDDDRRPSHVVILDTLDGTQLMSLKGHRHVIRSIAVSPAGDCIASSANDNTVMVWDLSTGSRVHAFTDMAYAADNVAYFPDGRRLIVAVEGSMTIYCVGTWKALRSISMSPCNGTSFSLSVNFLGTRIASTFCNNKRISVYDVEQQSEIFDLPLESACSACCFSPGGIVLM
jgi:WD40 repeat protein